MREYFTEAVELERMLTQAGTLTPQNTTQTLTQLVQTYALALPEVIPQFTEPLIDVATLALNKGQQKAWDKLQVWASNDEPYFVLKGGAGTGKTFLLQLLSDLSARSYYSAPTNKAAKVLSKSVGSPARTTYSMLGLRMEQFDDHLVLTASDDPPYFPPHSILVVDEASMVGTSLCRAIAQARKRCELKILYVGDHAQLRPIGEVRSKAWSKARKPSCRATLTEVMRNDDQLVVLATALRLCLKQKNWRSPLKSDHTDIKGIWKWKSYTQFEASLLQAVDSGYVDTKVIAWRNKTVDKYNKLIRKRLGFNEEFCVGDIILLAEPIEINRIIIAHTDDEFFITAIYHTYVFIDDDEVSVYQLHVAGDQTLILNVAKDSYEVDNILSDKARVAKAAKGNARKEAWRDFWNVKSKFNSVRYGYAITAHRSQGSTYTRVFVDQMDILGNRNKGESFQCLHVACTRPTTRLDTY